MIFYIYTVVGITLIAFSGMSNLSLITYDMDKSVFILVIACLLIEIMLVLRLYSMMKSGQILTCAIKSSSEKIEDILIRVPVSKPYKDIRNRTTILKNKLGTYQSVPPITAYSVISLNNKTFFGTLATMITYMVILMKLRGMEAASNSSFPIGRANETLTK